MKTVTTYSKTVTLVKGESEISAHVARGSFYKHSKGATIEVDGEFGRCGERCANDWHGDYESCKRDFLAYVGEKVLDGYTVKSVEVSTARTNRLSYEDACTTL